MAFTVRDFHDLVGLLRDNPEWQVELRHLLLTEELLTLPALVRQLVEVQQRAEERLGRLEAAVEQLSTAVQQLAAAQQQTEERLERLEAAVERLAAAQQRTEEQLEQLATAQQQTEERLERLEAAVERLAAAQQRTEERLEQLAAAQQQTEERLERLEAAVERLAAAQQRTEERLEQLAAAQQQTEQRLERLEAAVESLAERVGHLVDEVGGLKGRELERRYREYAPAYFSDLLRRIRVISPQELATLLEDAVEAGILSPTEQKDLLMSDVVVRGRRQADGIEVYLVAEVSVGIGQKDVDRAVKRARLLHRALQRPTMAAVAGEWINVEAERQARALGVWWVLDGTAHAPDRNQA